MLTQTLPDTDIQLPRLMLGCMLMGGRWNTDPVDSNHVNRACSAIEAAISLGINAFDHADIYCKGKSEQVFAAALDEMRLNREDLFLQSKCGIRFLDDPEPGFPGRYDFSSKHILASVDGILKRLHTDYIDLLLLHRPDCLMDPEEVAEAFDQLHNLGKVRYFGVSNQSPTQMDLLRKWLDQPLKVNQIQISLDYPLQIDSGILTTKGKPLPQFRAEGALDYCHLHNIIPQAWSPLAKGVLSGKPLKESEAHKQATADLVKQIAEKHSVSREAVLINWLMRHPAKIQPVIGTMNTERIQNAAEGAQGHWTLSREEWYELFISSRGAPLP
ncbi:MAG: aldo/keto reductase [Opitutales bacterium]|nr:aldo/keto reductase [Opitutales bacterium]NRA27151.1 aldo/keto reductase [Opitutales bacterium]